MKKQLLLLGLTFGLFTGFYNAQECQDGRYHQVLFPSVTKIADVKYGENQKPVLGGSNLQELHVDIYTPDGDTKTDRALVILAHGGSFIGGDKSDIQVVCEEFAKRGFVAVSLQYRLIDVTAAIASGDLGDYFKKGVVRAMHDMRAGIRFFRKSVVEDGNPYGIDPDVILTGGFSAGAILSNHVTYLDDEAKIPADLVTYIADQGGLEGNSGNPGFNSASGMSISWCGAILDTTFMSPNAQPYIGFHTDGDQTVPMLEGEPNIGLPIPVTIQGDSLMYQRAQNVGIESFYKTYFNNDVHCGFDQIETTLMTFDFIYDQLCGVISSVETEENINFTIYPNPANQSFFVQVPDNNYDWTVSVTNLMGQEIFMTSLDAVKDRIEIESSSFAKGIYLVNLTSKNGERATQKLIIE